MYLHIGKSLVIEEKKIIGIFGIDTINKDNNYVNFYNKENKKVIDISEGKPKTLILVEDKDIQIYITNISSATLRKR